MKLSHVVAIPNTYSGKGYLIPETSLQSHFAVCNFTLVPSTGASLNLCTFQVEPTSTVSTLLSVEQECLKILIVYSPSPHSRTFPKEPLVVALISAVPQEWDVLLVFTTLLE